MTTSTWPETRTGHDCYRTARTDGPIPALELLSDSLLRGMVPFGPAGHAVTTPAVAGSASHVWLDGVESEREPAGEQAVPRTAVPDGPILILRRTAPAKARAGWESAVRHDVWLSGLAWLRLGLSEALRQSCVSYLGGRRTGADGTLLQQQLVKGTLGEAVAAQLEVHAVLCDPDAAQTAGMAERLHRVLTATDRQLVHLLGAGGYVAGGAGQAVNLSELLADAYCRREPPW